MNHGSVGELFIRFHLPGPKYDNPEILPLRILVLGDWLQRPDPRPLEERLPFRLDPGTFNQTMAAQHLFLDLPSPRSTDDTVEQPVIRLAVSTLKDLSPVALAAAVPALGDPTSLRAVLHHPRLMAMEAAWRSLRFVVEGPGRPTNDRGLSVHIEALNVSKADLAMDVEDSPSPSWTALFRRVVGAAGRGETPYALVVTDYVFGPSDQDVALLRALAGVAGAAQSPVLAAASATLAGETEWSAVLPSTDLHGALGDPRNDRIRAFLASDDARFVALCLPRMRLRDPYRAAILADGSSFDEDPDGDAPPVWGSAAFELGVAAAKSFLRIGWCPNVWGHHLVSTDLHAATSVGPRVECVFSRWQRWALYRSRLDGVIDPSDGAADAAARSPQDGSTHRGIGEQIGILRPAWWEAHPAPTRDLRFEELPGVFAVAHVARYLQVVGHRYLAGGGDAPQGLLAALSSWCVAHDSIFDEHPDSFVSRGPLRKAVCSVVEEDADGNWRCELTARFVLGIGRLGKPMTFWQTSFLVQPPPGYAVTHSWLSVKDDLLPYAKESLKPISLASPAGIEVSNDAVCIGLAAEVASLERPISDRVDAQRVESIATVGHQLLTEKSKHLTIAAYAAYATLRREPDDNGLLKAVALLTGLVELYWETMFPLLNEIDRRVEALVWFIHKASIAIDERDRGAIDYGWFAHLVTATERLQSSTRERMGTASPDFAPLLAAVRRLEPRLPRSRGRGGPVGGSLGK